MAEPTVHFVSGLPRSGSTLLMNLLGQHPGHHVTPTNDLIDLIAQVRNRWMHCISFKSQGLENIRPRIGTTIGAMIHGFYIHELTAGKTVFDKSRGWPAYIEMLEEALGRKVHIIVTVRDMRAILSSFEKIHRKSGMTKHSTRGNTFFDVQTVDGRCRQFLHKSAVVGIAVNRIRDALDRGLGDRLTVVPYRSLTHTPLAVLEGLHERLELEPYGGYDPENVEQLTREDDTVHGMDLHTIRPKIEPSPGRPWDGVLPPRTCQWIAQQYADINAMAAVPELDQPAATPEPPAVEPEESKGNRAERRRREKKKRKSTAPAKRVPAGAKGEPSSPGPQGDQPPL